MSASLGAALLCLVTAALVTGAQPTDAPMLGAYPCDSFVQHYWRDTNSAWAEASSIPLLRQAGFEWLRFGVTVQSHPELARDGDWSVFPWQPGFWSCREVGERALREAAEAGMRLYLMLFLSDTAAHGGQQIPPAAWQHLDLRETARRIEAYCAETADYFKRRGLDIEVYEIGNEIERGLCGFRPDERIARPPEVDQLRDLVWLRRYVWEPNALLLKAGIRGVKSVDPEAKIVLHVATRPAPEDKLTVAFFEAMDEAGVEFDVAGLSYYPWIGYPTAPPNADWRAELGRWVKGIARLGKPVVICEYSYPHHPPTPEPGMVAAPLPGYPFSPEGQAAWLRDFLGWCRERPEVVGSFYFYPDHVWRPEEPERNTEGLFQRVDTEVRPLPALLGLHQAGEAGRRRGEAAP